MPYNLDLFYEPSKLGAPEARICVATSTRQGSLRFVTPSCLNKDEFNAQVDRLVRELEAARNKANGEFDAHNRHRT